MAKTTKKKSLTTLLVVVLLAVVAIGGMLAYLTDRDSKTNVFTVGDVKIELNEDFVQESTLVPGVDIKKEVNVKNTGKNDAYVWVKIAVPAALDNDDASLNVLHFNYSKDADYGEEWTWKNESNEWIVEENKEINGVLYNEYVVLHKAPLAVGAETTYPAMTKVYLDDHVDIDTNGDWYHVENGVVTDINWNSKRDGNPYIYVSAYAIQVEEMTDVYAAYAAYQGQWGDKGDEYGAAVEVEGNNKAALVKAINAANSGDTVVMQEDTKVAGYAATDKLVIDKDITLDLNGYTLTTESGWGGIDAKGGVSIKNGTINHVGNTAAIKAFQVGTIEDVTINVTETAGKVKGGIVVQEGSGCYVNSIKNVTINGATNGIETFRCGSRNDLAINSIENVKIDATETGILLSAPIGKVTNSTIKGDKIGVNMYLYGPYSVSMELVNSTVEGATGIYAHDEVGLTNPGTFTLKYDNATTINGGITQEFEAEVSSRVFINK